MRVLILLGALCLLAACDDPTAPWQRDTITCTTTQAPGGPITDTCSSR